MIYHILDLFFLIFHTSLIIFNTAGWIWRKSRFLNLILLLLTGSSWLVLGFIVGTPGYCPLTDWHFMVLDKSGYTGLPSSYIEYLAERITGLEFEASVVDRTTLIVFICSLLMSLALNLKDLHGKRRVQDKR